MKNVKNIITKWGSVSAAGICATALLVYVINPFNIYGKSTTQSTVIIIEPVAEYVADYNELYKGLIDSEKMFQASADMIYQLTVDERLTYFFSSAEEVTATLELVLSSSIANTITCDVQVAKEDNTLTPVITFTEQPVLKLMLNELSLTGNSVTDTSTMNAETTGAPVIAPSKIATKAVRDNVTDFDFNETIKIDQVKILGQHLTTPEEAATELLKTNVTPDTYTVASGDSPSVIASNNDMSLNDLYQLNEGLSAKATSLKIGDTVVVEKLIPELSVIVKFIDIYNKSIPNGTVYQEDDSIYKGLKVVADVGYNGIMRVTDEVETSNDEEISRTTLEEEIISQTMPKLVLVGTKPIPATGSVGFFIKPLSSYRFSSPFGPRWGRMHNGIDMAVPTGTSVKAADGGTVTYSGWKGGYGYMVEIKHNDGMVTRYAHNSKILVSVGQEVGQGQIITKSGNTGTSTGPHLHFEVIKDGECVDPMDYLK